MILKKFYSVVFTGLFAGVMFFGCMTPSEPVEKPQNVGPTHYTLRLGEKIKHHRPLPTYTPIMVDWHYKNGAVRSVLGFKGWDLNHDGRLDMLEVLDEKGNTLSYVYDFNFDGEVDLKQHIR